MLFLFALPAAFSVGATARRLVARARRSTKTKRREARKADGKLSKKLPA